MTIDSPRRGSLTAYVADFVAALRYERLPDDVLELVDDRDVARRRDPTVQGRKQRMTLIADRGSARRGPAGKGSWR